MSEVETLYTPIKCLNKPGFCDNLCIITQIQEETRFLSPHPSPPIQLIVNRHQPGEHQLIRVIDESGEDYLYPVAYFVPIALPPAVAAVFA
ncbi:hypothetical protein [Microcoleus sp.]|uniref:hypothetical protein n=1 Tax=Microcoleus sp. TaxID=44472 RepID=UPI003525C0B2